MMDLSLRGAWRFWRRNATVYSKIWSTTMLPNFLEPVLYLAAMGYGLGRYVNIGDTPYLQFIAPGLLASSTMMGATFATTYNIFVHFRWSKVYEGVRATPLSPEDIAVGELLWGGTRGLMYGAAFLTVIALMGLAPSWTTIFLPPVLFTAGLLFSAVGMAYSSVIHSIDFFSFYFTLFITPMFLFSGIFFPLDGWPGWAQGLAGFTPLFHLVKICRGLVLGWPAGEFMTSVLWLVAVTAGLMVVPVIMFRRRLVA